MIVIVAALAGAILGAFNAKRRGGKAADMAQYAIAHAIIFALLAYLAAIIARLLTG